MTVDEIARRFALDAAELAKVLARAQKAHDDAPAYAEELLATTLESRRLRPHWERLEKKLADVLKVWETTDPEARRALAWVAYCSNVDSPWCDGLDLNDDFTIPAPEFEARVEEHLRSLHELTAQTADIARRDKHDRGRHVQFVGLHAMVAVLRPFWERVTGTAFVHDNRRYDEWMGPREYNLAQDFLLACIEHLGYAYTLKNCRSVLKKPRN